VNKYEYINCMLYHTLVNKVSDITRAAPVALAFCPAMSIVYDSDRVKQCRKKRYNFNNDQPSPVDSMNHSSTYY